MKLNKFTGLIVLLLILVLPLITIASKPGGMITMAFGQGNHITYNLKTGTYTVFHGQEIAFFNVTSAFTIRGTTALTTGNFSREYTSIEITDGFGKGVKHIITLKGGAFPKIEQVFYTYPGREFFLTQIVLTGKGLGSNSILPFSGNIPAVAGDARSIFFPFDNDTFIRYNAKQFIAPFLNASSEVGTIYNNNTRKGYITGSVEHEVWKTGITTSAKKDSGNAIIVQSGYTDKDVTRDHIVHGEVKGDIIRSPKIFVGYFNDWRKGMEAYAKANRIAEPPFVFNWTQPTPVGWNSWGVMQDKLTFEKATKVADFFADSLAKFRTGNTAFIDLDSYWDFMLKGGLEGDYSKLKEFAAYCKSKGLQPGVYWAPFTDWGWKDGPDRKVTGTNYTYGEIWTKVGNDYHEIDGARAIDPTHPGTLKRIDLVIGKLKECGFKMIKIDFLGHATAESTHFYDTTVTTGMQAYRKGMEYLVNKLDNQMLIYAAISPNLATGRYVHTRRIACDAFKSLHDTQYTLNSLSYGWWQTYLYNYIDADHVVLSTEDDGANRARILSALITGTFITGDDFSVHGKWSQKAITIYQDPELLKVIRNGKAFEPVEGNTGENSSEMFTQKIGSDLYIAVFNFSGNEKIVKLDPERLGFKPSSTYKLQELLQGNILNDKQDIKVGAGDARLYKLSGAL
jgi:alpha-galactosidase